MKIQESGENYLETILLLEMRNGTVRAVDIANELGYSKPSVTRAMGVAEKGWSRRSGAVRNHSADRGGTQACQRNLCIIVTCSSRNS